MIALNCLQISKLLSLEINTVSFHLKVDSNTNERKVHTLCYSVQTHSMLIRIVSDFQHGLQAKLRIDLHIYS